MAKSHKFFYDTEFLEDGKTIDLISIGIVNYETGDEFYAVSKEFDTQAVASNAWLMQNVMPSIGYEEFLGSQPVTGKPCPDFTISDPAAMYRHEIRDGIMEFVKGSWPDFWAWYGAYDHVALCQLWGRMIDLPSRMPMFTSDLKQMHKAAGRCEMPKQPEGLHNALADAKFNIVRYEFLKAELEKQGKTVV